MPESPDDTSPHGLDEGLALALRAQDSGDWKPVVDWLGRHPGLAERLARFVGGERDLGRALRTPPAARVGAVLGEFELLDVLGRGAMGVVYRAADRRIGREVALKVVITAGLSPAELARARFEAEAMAGLSHPHVVPLFAYGETDAELYFAMPLMTGGSLAGWLKGRGPDRCLPAARAAEVVRDVALGVHHAHQRGLIHRDLKPANVLLDRDGGPHVADFGLARRADATATAAAGSPAYMAPEQAAGERHLTTAVDVHALGVILFELLTGRPPFGGGDVASVLRRVIEDPAPPVGGLRPDAPGDLRAICARCLKKHPQDRYPSARAVADDLTKFLNGERIDERRGWVWGNVARSLGWQRETTGMGSWWVGFAGALSTALAMAAVQAAVLTGAPKWVPTAALAYYLAAWLLIVWGFLVAQRDARNPVERASTALHLGAMFGCAAVLPAQLWLSDGDATAALPAFLTVVGVVVFAHGLVYWGMFYLVGLALMGAVALMPLVPRAYWPSVYGAILVVLQVWGALHLRRVHLSAARPGAADPDPTTTSTFPQNRS